jgi:homoserine kinase
MAGHQRLGRHWCQILNQESGDRSQNTEVQKALPRTTVTLMLILRSAWSNLAVLLVMAVSIQVPASTTNLGPGFDCLGIALQLWNRIRIDVDRSEGPAPEMVSQAAALFFKHTGKTRFPFSFSMEGDVPQARGLGSSVTIRLGILIALDRITQSGLSKEEICALCAELEGHPDNAAAALFGGFTIVTKTRVARFNVDPALKFVLFIPNFEVKTGHARTVVPASFSRQDVVENLGNASLIAAALASGEYGLLRGALVDRLHQPFREKFVPFLSKLLRTAANAGALGGFLSGSGSTVAFLTLSDGKEVISALEAAAPEERAKILVVSADNDGARVL